MNKRIVLVVLLFFFIAFQFACTTKRNLSPEVREKILRELSKLEFFPDRVDTVRIPRKFSDKHLDLGHLDLSIRLDWEQKRVMGYAEWSGRIHAYSQREIWLDAKGMLIHEVLLFERNGQTIDTVNVSFEYDQYRLRIPLGREYLPNDSVFFSVRYTARPHELHLHCPTLDPYARGLNFVVPGVYTPQKPYQVWTQGEPECASIWFPVQDRPNEKITHRLRVDVDSVYETLSNGRLMSSLMLGNGQRRDEWSMEMPHAPYLVMLVVGEFHKRFEEWEGKRVGYYVEKSFGLSDSKIFPNTLGMLSFFSERLSYPYPWPKYDQVVVRDYTSGAMENTTAVVFGEFVQMAPNELIDDENERIVAHELFHHWFGDLVTCESWVHLSLNESFANYSEYLWFEHKYGRARAEAHFYEEREGYLREAYTGKRLPVVRHHYFSKEDMFDAHSYNKGGQILHLLRKQLGDEVFFKGLGHYLKQREFKTADIHHLRHAFEDVSGTDLHYFFDQWFLRPGHPEFEVFWEVLEGNGGVRVVVNQNQREGIAYQLPLTIAVFTESGVKPFEVFLMQLRDTFTIHVDGNVFFCLADPDFRIPAEWKQSLSAESLMMMYDSLPGYMGKRYALEWMYNLDVESELFYSLLSKAMADSSMELRMVASERFARSALPKSERANGLRNQYEREASPAFSVLLLNLMSDYEVSDDMGIFISALESPYPAVQAIALEGIYWRDQELGLSYAEKLVGSTSSVLVSKISEIFANHPKPEYASWFSNHYDYMRDNSDEYNFISSFATWLMEMPEDMQKQHLSFFWEILEHDPMYVARLAAYIGLFELSSRAEEDNRMGLVIEIQPRVMKYLKREKNNDLLGYMGFDKIPD